MSLLSRYILRAHIGPFLLAFSIITFVLVMDFIFEIANLIVSKGLGIFLVIEIFVLNLAWIVALSLPMSVLVATLMAFGRLSSDNEITGFRAGGVSFYRLLSPVLLAGCLLTLGHLYFLDRVLPEANYHARSLMNDVHQARPTLGFREGSFMDEIQGYSILVDRISPTTNEVSSITIYETRTSGMPRILTAQRGELDLNADGSVITLTLFNGELHQQDEKTPGRYYKEVFAKQRVLLRGEPRGVQRSGAGDRTDRELSIDKMASMVDEWRSEINERRALIQQAQSELEKTPEERAKIEKDARIVIDSHQQQINGYQVEIHKKYAIPIACLVFILIGGPLGMTIRRSGMGLSVGVSLIFFLIYWVCLIGGEELANRNLLSPILAMWGANILIGLPGVYLVVRIARERPLRV